MPPRPSNSSTLRLTASRQDTERELRASSFTLVNHFLEMHWTLSRYFDLRPAELLILLATIMGNAQRIAQPNAMPDFLRYAPALPVPDALMLPMSRRAIARATGLPLETVRRTVERMAARGLLVIKPQGVQAKPGILSKRDSKDVAHRLIEQHAAHTEVLMHLGVVKPTSAAR